MCEKYCTRNLKEFGGNYSLTLLIFPFPLVQLLGQGAGHNGKCLSEFIYLRLHRIGPLFDNFDLRLKVGIHLINCLVIDEHTRMRV
jgi:hypothetical protein